MATYQDIKGLKVKYLSADPGTLRAGEVWYNSTTGTLKGVVSFGAWSSSSPISTARYGSGQGGTATAGFIVSGGPAPKVQTEEFNGTGWSTGEDVSVDSYFGGGAGTLTAGLYSGGEYPPGGNTDRTIEYDGTNWTTVTAYPQALKMIASCGTQTSALYATGVLQPPAGAKQTETREYNGSAWISGGAYPTGIQAGNMTGASSTSAILMGGSTISPSLSANTYNGTAWAAAPDANSAAQSCGSSGIETSAIFFGGGPGYLTATQSFDGSTWTTEGALGTGVASLPTGPMTAASTNAFKVGGAESPDITTSVEEFNKSINTVTSAAWASITAYPTPATGIGGVGSSTAGLFFGGENPGGSPISTSTTYDGSSWTATSAMGNASQLTLNFGTQASAVAAGGEPVSNTVEEWGGSSWSTAPNTISDARRNGGGSGSGEPSGVIFGGGEHPSYSTSCEAYDGTSWSEGGDLPNGKLGVGAGDSATAALFAGDAQNPSPPYSSNVSQEYNGTSWTATPNLLINRGNGPSGASTGANSGGGAYYAGGTYPSLIASMETYNGSAWSTAPSLGTAIWNQGGNGSTAGALSVGGSLPAYTAAAEEFTAETSVATASTLTTS